MIPVVYLIVPCYNEESVLPESSRRFREKFRQLIDQEQISPMSRICFVDDGSRDRTWELIEGLHRQDPLFSGIRLSRNRGHQNAVLCGYLTMKDRADCVISIDADLQDDIHAIDEMIEKFRAGSDVVYGVRSKRETDTPMKRITAEGFYRVMEALGTEAVFNHADYRLLSRKALDALAGYEEVNLFLRGLVPLVGFPSDVVYYERSERFAGESKYPLKKMLQFAWQGITSMSIRPIKIITGMGTLIFLLSLCMVVYFLIQHFTGHTVAGWSSIVVSIWAIGGLQMLAIGIVGEYVGKTYLESKHRPRFHVQTILDSTHGTI